MKTTKKKVGKFALPLVDKHSHINDFKLSDPTHGTHGLQPERDGRVRWSAW
jgi:hypothetical protein